MFKISIPTPCHEDWQAMTPNEQGRHCTSCAKTVVDFTVMSDDEVKYFFLNKKEERVCGRFNNVQLQCIIIELPHNIFYIPMPGWKKFLVASLLVFSATLFSCETTVKGEPDFTCSTTGLIIPTAKKHLNNDSTIGKPLVPVPPPLPVIVGTLAIIVDTSITQGDIAIVQPAVEEISKGQIVLPDTLNTNKLDAKKITNESGEVELKGLDSLKLKNPLKADSINCDIKVFY
jgi:hypothetical protein